MTARKKKGAAIAFDDSFFHFTIIVGTAKV